MRSILDDEGAVDAVPELRSALSDSSAPKNEGMTVCWMCGTFRRQGKKTDEGVPLV
jgi:hypothetical protein